MARSAKPAPPYFAAPYNVDFHPAAMRALAEGKATEHQQREALKWIVDVACATYQTVFIPGDPHSTSFFAGRQFAGQQIVKLLKLNSGVISTARQKGNSSN